MEQSQTGKAEKGASAGERARILVVDDAPVTLAILNKILSRDYAVSKASGGRQALELLRQAGADLVLSDIFMTGMSGLELLKELKADERLLHIPVMMVTADGNAENEVEALRLGAADVVRKPITPQILLARVRNLLALQASFLAQEQSWKDRQELKAQAETLRFIERDELTGLLTRQAFCRHVRDYLNAHPGEALEMIRFDLDNFASINDLLGVKAGDRLLRDIGQEVLSYGDYTTDIPVAGHIEADHFAALHNPARQSAEELFSYVQSWLKTNEAEFRPNGRFGVYAITEPDIDPAVMCDRALLALRSTKGSFTQRVARYDESMRRKLLEEQKLTEEMLPALQSGQFEVYYQPQVNYSADELLGAEALVRWNHPKKGLISPSVFLPLFERNGQITQLDNFVWEKVCRQLAVWTGRLGEKVPPVSVNISRMDTYGEDLLSRLTGLTDQYGIPRALLRLEITESAYVGDALRLCEIVEQLSAAGFTIEMDDFGSAYSSLNMLKDIPVDILKLDMKFLSDTKNSARGGNILSSVVRMARWLKLPVIAEGVETREQADYLCSIGCLYMQGYYFSRPLPLREYEAYLADRPLGKTDKYCNTDISAAEKFWDASAQTALIFNSYVGGAIILNRTGKKLEMLRANDEFFKVIHSSHEEYLPYMLDVWQRFSPEDRTRYSQMLDRAARGDPEASCDLWSLPLADGKSEWTRNRARLLARNGGSDIFYVLVDNITAEKNAQEELSRQKEMLSELYNGVPCGILDYLVTDDKPQMVNFNDTAWRLSGYDSRAGFEASYKKTMGRSMVHPDDLPLLLEKTRAALESGVHTTAECRMEREDHSFFWAEVRLQRYVNGGTVMLQSIFVDIGDRREQETQQYSKTLFSIFDEIYLWDYRENTSRTLKGLLSSAPARSHSEHLDEMNREWIAKYVLPEDREALSRFIRLADLQAACAGEDIPFTDYRVRLEDGTVVSVRASAFAMDQNRFMICCRDVTREKQAMEQAKQIAVLQAKLEEEERYRIIVEQTGAAVIEWNHKTGEFFQSGTYSSYAMSGCEPDELFRNQGRLNTVYKADLPELERFFADSKSGKPSAVAVLRLKMTDGSYRWTRMRGDFLFDAAGAPVRTIGTLTDIDNEMRAKETLRETNDKLENIISNIPAGVGIYRVGKDGSIIPLYISDRTCRIFGFTREECDARIAAGAPISFMPDLSSLPAGRLEAAMRGESISVPKLLATRKDGSRFWLRLTCSFIVNGNEPPVCYATLLDVSQQVESERTADSIRELYQLLIESTETITVDYSVPGDRLRLSFVDTGNAREEKLYPDYIKYLESGESHVALSSRPELLRAIRSASAGEVRGELDIQALDPDGAEHWYHIKFLSLAEEGAVYRIVGRADNLDGIVRTQEARLEQAQLDRVTGLRNKDSARPAVEEKLRVRPARQQDVIFFLDIDNFKDVNDTQGHLEGDRVLSEIGSILKKGFRGTDLVARFGGDEFLIYMVAPESPQAVQAKATWILNAVRNIPVGKSKELSCSIGIAEVTGALRDFDEAFHCADRAMYLAKKNGKNRFVVCHCEQCGHKSCNGRCDSCQCD